MTPRAQVLDAYRTGGGVPYADYGPDLRIGQSRMNRTAFLNLLPTDWFPQITALHVRLQADPPARVADIGFGGAWSCIGIAKGYPKVLVDGFDNDEASVVMARENVEKAELSDRISLHVRDAGDPELAGKYDLVTAFECVHDMSDPVAALSAMRRLANENGTVLIMDERVSDQFADSNEVDQFMYGWSFHHCLPVGMVDKPSAETGTVMRTATLRGYAEEAGFQNFEVLPIDNFFFRFYRLTP
jgi:cyclopropane fatty-acyl-phospholipid synthase-like methyltransferase